MKILKYTIPGVLFGIIMTKSEAISWFRIQEMFRFESFHMYGIIGVAVTLATLMTFIIKKTNKRNIEGKEITFSPKNKSVARYMIGGIIFGLGWAMTGACPGPLFTLVGHGILTILIVIASAVLGTYVYGLLRTKLPH
ncbi:MAG: YeeE/YedE family protein [Saprospiraceae bacterium]|nr:YeeE/YedE family protein [Saprospiraceae bacterium]